ncbi:uncharacterized protein LOC105848122 [Hydra vulgaris]|uniref:uncharacterized protein LOC105848122 n=1 Tax=Hydra vulgaris TaxID=6087 RepID=UPI001F5F76BA|nr:cAMP-dependent protein kinase type 2-like [Hydra vulgaris]
MNEESFRTNMMKVAKNLTKEDIKYIKFNYNKKIGEGVLEKIDSAIELLTILEQQGFLNYNNYEPFAKLLIQLGKQQLVKDCFPDKLKRGQLKTENFKIVKLLGSGGYGKVYLCTEKNTGEKFAMKCIESENTDRNVIAQQVEQLKQEISVFKTLNHIRIVKYYGFTYDSTSISILMEYMEGVYKFC